MWRAIESSSLKGKLLWEAAAAYEAERGGISSTEVIQQMKQLARSDGGSGSQAGFPEQVIRTVSCHRRVLAWFRRSEAGKLIPADINNRIIRYVSAIMEVKSSMRSDCCGSQPPDLAVRCLVRFWQWLTRSRSAKMNGLEHFWSLV